MQKYSKDCKEDERVEYFIINNKTGLDFDEEKSSRDDGIHPQ